MTRFNPFPWRSARRRPSLSRPPVKLFAGLAAFLTLGSCTVGCESTEQRARKLVDLRYRQNVSGKEVARKLSLPVNTVYVAMSRIHRTLSECVRRHLAQAGIRHV